MLWVEVKLLLSDVPGLIKPSTLSGSGYRSAHNIKHTTVPVRTVVRTARVNQQPPMHQLAVMSIGWATFFHSVPDGVHHTPLPFTADHYIYIYIYIYKFFKKKIDLFFIVLFLNLTSHIATLITSYPIDLAIILTTYPINLVILLTTSPIDLTSILT